MDSERFGEFTATSFGDTVVLLEGRHPDAEETLTIDRHNLPHLEQALAWARARFMSTVKCATCPHFTLTRSDAGTPIAVCHYAAMKGGPIPRVPLDGSGHCHHHPDFPKD